ncbi:hypothetical protein GEMRC1_004626 [Eukaryota sp. GEM-RC1]
MSAVNDDKFIFEEQKQPVFISSTFTMSDSVNLVIRTPDPRSRLDLNQVPRTLTILELKNLISEQFPTPAPVEHQKLIFMGRVLDNNDKTLLEILPGRAPLVQLSLVVSDPSQQSTSTPASPVVVSSPVIQRRPPPQPRNYSSSMGTTVQEVPRDVWTYLENVRDSLSAKHRDRQRKQYDLPENYVRLLTHLPPATPAATQPLIGIPRNINRQLLRYFIGGLVLALFVGNQAGFNSVLWLILLVSLFTCLFFVTKFAITRLQLENNGRFIDRFVHGFMLFIYSLFPAVRPDALVPHRPQQHQPDDQPQEQPQEDPAAEEVEQQQEEQE